MNEDYKIPEINIDFSTYNHAAITGIQLNCTSDNTDPFEPVDLDGIVKAATSLEAIFRVIIWHTPYSTILRVCEETVPSNPVRAGETIPIILNGNLTNVDALMSTVLNNFDGYSGEPIPAFAQAMTLFTAVSKINSWCPSMKWEIEGALYNARN